MTKKLYKTEVEIECPECGQKWLMKYSCTEKVMFCAFCGEELVGVDELEEDSDDYEEFDEDEEDLDW